MNHYILNGKTPVQADFRTWAAWFAKSQRHVADVEVAGARVSTVFLGLDHSFGDGPPVLFETMVFGGALDGEMDRYSTWEQAEVGHAAMCERVSYVTDGRLA